ncbi:MAG: glycosyltransferase family 2 protein [Luteibacter sp.]|uniref:glycosyltransferase family 2 protein n=1 Tax=Luteibacter sp. TaxID=1886636 RepID=UPI002808AE48|nr:glycosyltransferase family 2 protein [Luteibacter sp.]MDQ7997144.1 glycosyltransferase family 2 protein [Luteibacter sp.]MDQ8049794.1 glycosyltransferase family 2 protein [Luteibacter sp.]
MTICAVIVTFNRVALLERCVAAMLAQTRLPDRILVVDNASSDDTEARMTKISASEPRVHYHRLASNTGGAGGFAEGLRVSSGEGFDWAWIMDDDAEPHEDALEALERHAHDPMQLYGSVAVQGEQTSWMLTVMDEEPKRNIFRTADLRPVAPVRFLPFLGLLVHRDTVSRIGLPDAGFFIAADDVEYCMRAQRGGSQVFAVGSSRIEHPRADMYLAVGPGRHIHCLRLAPWKRYYDTRNRLIIAREYYGRRLYSETIPGTILRWISCMIHEKQRMRQTWAFIAGTWDGLRGHKGARHHYWNINA